MNTIPHLCAAFLALAISITTATAQMMVVFADSQYRPALNELVPTFTAQTGFPVQTAYNDSDQLAGRIINGKPVDLFFPESEAAMDRVKEKGLIDVALMKTIVTRLREDGETDHLAAAVAIDAVNRLQAMAFLEYLSSEPARAVFLRHGFSPP